jgi:acyl-CoA thioester hydrolase
MSKTQLDAYPFSLPVRVRFADTDLQGHVFFAHYLTYCDEALMAYLEVLGFSWKTLGNMGLELYYVETNCQFKGRAFFADILNVNVRIAEIGRSAMTAEMLITRSESNEVVALGRITAVMVSSQTGRSTPIPSDIRKAINEKTDLHKP